MIDLHTHTIFSDGECCPSELIRRAAALGFRAIALTDHADMSNFDLIIPRIVRACEENEKHRALKVIPGVELTHLPPQLISQYTAMSRELGAKIVVVHGESLAEPVEPGTNRAAIEAGADILSHPGLITVEDARMAAERGVCLEISARKGHCLANGHVVGMARETGADLVLNTDAHAPGDFISEEKARAVALGAGMTKKEHENMRKRMAILAGLIKGSEQLQ